MKRMARKWINQPSTLQQYHKYHGKNVLYDATAEEVWFTEGDVISMQIDPLALSDGWTKQTKTGESRNENL